MSHKHRRIAAHALIVLPIMAGFLLMAGGRSALRADLMTGDGTILSTDAGVRQPKETLVLKPTPESMHAAAKGNARNAGVQLILGLLLVMIGFTMHVLFLMKDDRSVHITRMNGSGIKRKSGAARALEAYWLEK